MNPAVNILTVLFSVLMPQKMWYAPNQPLTVTIKSDKPVTLDLTEYAGKTIAPDSSADIAPGASVDVKEIFSAAGRPGIYILYARPKGAAPIASGAPKDFLGTPLVIEVLRQPRTDPPQTMVLRVVPLQYVVITTAAGPATAVFYYDVAHHTVDSFIALATQGYYDGLTFHRIVPGFVLQGGDPSGTGFGGPGYHVEAEFSNRPHLEGVLSMARVGDPDESSADGILPRAEFANSAGTQFFICLDYRATKTLDNAYTAFGRVVRGMDAMKKIAATPLADAAAGVPVKPQYIEKMEVFGVTAQNNPYAELPADSAPTK